MKHFSLSTLTIYALIAIASGASAKDLQTSESGEKPVVGSISAKNLSVKDYPKAAKIGSGQAAKIATDTVPGEILSLGLEKEDGFLVYAVEVVNPDSGLNELNIDAGNGKVLSIAKKGSKGSERHEDDEKDDD